MAAATLAKDNRHELVLAARTIDRCAMMSEVAGSHSELCACVRAREFPLLVLALVP